MTINGEELLHAAEIIAQKNNFKVALKNSMLGGVIGGVTTCAGGLLLGPVGLAIGGAGGGALAYIATKGKFKSVAKIIQEDLSRAQRNQLVQHLRTALKDFDLNDVASLSLLIMNNSNLQSIIAYVLKEFLQSHLKMKIQQ